MFEKLFQGVFDTDMTRVITPMTFLLCIGCALLVGLFMAFAYRFHSRCTKSFTVTLAVLPAVVCVVIMMVNGNVGTGVAVAGAFSLVRFRSAPGSAREISALFVAMGAGLIAGMGYLAYAVLFALIMGIVMIIYNCFDFGAKKQTAAYKILNITIPEDLDYSQVFDQVLDQYTRTHELVKVKTTNMGSMFRLTYEVEMRKDANEKEMLDQLRCRNGNLEITVSRQETAVAEL